MRRLRHLWCVLLSVILAVLFLSSSVFAQGDPPKEGVNYRIVHPRDGNPEWTYFEILPHQNVNTHKLAESLRTDMWSIREDNPTGTLAVCETSPGHFSISPGIKDPEGRRTNAVWASCAKEKQYVYLLYSTILVLKGKKHLSFDEKQQVIASLQNCKDRSCLLENGSKLSGTGALEKAGAGIGAATLPEVVSTSPPSPATTTAEKLSPPPAVPPKAPASVQTEERGNWPFWSAICLAMAAILLSFWQYRVRLYTERQLEKQLEVPNRVTQYNQLSSRVAIFCSSLTELMLGEEAAKKLKKKEPLTLLTETLDAIQSRAFAYQTSVFEHAKALNGDEPVRFDGYMDPSFIERLTARLTKALSMRVLKDDAEKRIREAREQGEQSRSGQEVSQQSINEVFAAFTGGMPSESVRELSPQEQLEELKCLIHERDDSSRMLGRELVRLVIGSEEIPQLLPFSHAQLYEINTVVHELLRELESVTALSEMELPTLASRVRYVSKESTLERFRRRCEEQAIELARLKSEKTKGTLVMEAMAPEHVGGLLARNAELEARVAHLEEQRACLKDRLRETEDVSQAATVPTLRDHQSSSPDIEVAGPVLFDSASAEARSGRTMAPPPKGMATSNLDTRSPKRRSAFAGVHSFADMVEGHVTFKLEHDSELPLIRRLAQLLNRNFQWESPNGDTYTFKPGKLLNEQYWAAIAG